MNYYVVERLLDRRVRDEDGVLEYKVRWKDYDSDDDSWEPRSNLIESCAEEIQNIDQKKMKETDKLIEAWRRQSGLLKKHDTSTRSGMQRHVRKRSRSPEAYADADGNVETLSCVLLSYKGIKEPSAAMCQDSDPSTSMAPETTPIDASIVLLGELIVTEQTAALLSSPRSRRGTMTARGCCQNEASRYCNPAQNLEQVWREKFGVSLMHSCVACEAITPVKGNFTTTGSPAIAQAKRMMAKNLQILGIVPAESRTSGYISSDPATFTPWTADKPPERVNRESTANFLDLPTVSEDLLKPHDEGALVRYALSDNFGACSVQVESTEAGSSDLSEGKNNSEAKGDKNSQKTAPQVISSMPLSVFRTVFPQLLIDYLLEHSVVLQST